MMKRLALTTLMVQMLIVTAFGETKEGACNLKRAQSSDDNVFKVQVGDKIKGTCEFCVVDFFGKKVINANVQIVNTSDKTMHCQYYVAFFDNDGKLIGCAAQGTFIKKGLAAGESTQLGSCLIPLPAGFHEKAVQYKVAFYESDREIGKLPDVRPQHDVPRKRVNP